MHRTPGFKSSQEAFVKTLKPFLLPQCVSFRVFVCCVFRTHKRTETPALDKCGIYFCFTDWEPQAFLSTCSLTSLTLAVWQVKLPKPGLKSLRGLRWAWPWVISRPLSIPVWPVGQMQVNIYFVLSSDIYLGPLRPSSVGGSEGQKGGKDNQQPQYPVDGYSVKMKNNLIPLRSFPGSLQSLRSGSAPSSQFVSF